MIKSSIFCACAKKFDGEEQYLVIQKIAGQQTSLLNNLITTIHNLKRILESE